MLHVDVKKLGNIPDGGGWCYVGRRQGEKNRAATPGKLRSKHSAPLMGQGLRPHRHRRLLPRRLRRDPRRRNRTYRHRGSGEGCRVVQLARRHCLAGSVGQRRGISLTPVARHLRRARYQAQADQAVSASDQRQDREIPPHPGRRLGLRPLLHLRDGAPRRTRRLAALLQPSPAPHGLREPAALLTIDQRLRSVHLACVIASVDLVLSSSVVLSFEALTIGCNDVLIPVKGIFAVPL